MKLNLKSTIAAPADHKSLNGIIGNTKRGIVVDQTLDPDSNNPVSNKPVSTALAALAGKIDAALQKPTGLTKTKLVGVGAQGQENIEIGDNLTLANGKLAAVGGSVSPTLNLIDFENGEIRTSITEEEYNNLKNGLYNSVNYYTEVEYDAYLPSKLISAYDDSDESLICIFSNIKITGTSETDASLTNIIYQLNIGQKDTSGNYPITIEKEIEIPFGSGSGGIPVIEGTLDEERSDDDIKYYNIPEAQTSAFIFHSADIGYLFVNVLDDVYVAVSPKLYGPWYSIRGNNTVIAVETYNPASLYPINIKSHFPNDETTSVDITFPLIDRLVNPACIVSDGSDTDVSRVFVRNGNSIGNFQTPIIYCTDRKYRCWYIEGKEGDNTGKFATVKCKIINIGGHTPTITFED